MGLGPISRVAKPAALVVLVGAIVGCGSSVADADAPDPSRAAAAPPSPFCTAAEANLQAIRPLSGFLAQGRVPPEELNDTAGAVRRAGAEMVLAAPEEIRFDVERTVQAVDLQLDALVANGGDAAALRDADLTNRLNSPEFTGAGERVRAYVERTCTVGSARR
jgi:hypothetical protein